MEVSWLEVFGTSSSWEVYGVSRFFVASVVVLMAMDTFLGNAPIVLLMKSGENPEFHDLMRMDKSHWPRCLLWHGWQPLLSRSNGAWRSC